MAIYFCVLVTFLSGGGALIWALGHAHMYSSCQSEVRHSAEAKDALAISLLS